MMSPETLSWDWSQHPTFYGKLCGLAWGRGLSGGGCSGHGHGGNPPPPSQARHQCAGLGGHSEPV